MTTTSTGPSAGSATARANVNIALVKYWGKMATGRNIPAATSVSLTVDGLWTETTVELDESLKSDRLWIDGTEISASASARVSAVLQEIRDKSAQKWPRVTFANVRSANNFPTGAGLASSASGFAALVAAGAKAYGFAVGSDDLSRVARRGSGSSARSLFGGFVELPGGASAGDDPAAQPVETHSALSVRMIFAIVDRGPKEISSRDGMGHTAKTSPYYAAWLATAESDSQTAISAIRSGDLARLGEVTEASALAMHASALAARPAVIYFRSVTLAILARIKLLRQSGLRCWFTADAGPHGKALVHADDAAAVSHALAEVPGVLEVRSCAPGIGAHIV